MYVSIISCSFNDDLQLVVYAADLSHPFSRSNMILHPTGGLQSPVGYSRAAVTDFSRIATKYEREKKSTCPCPNLYN